MHITKANPARTTIRYRRLDATRDALLAGRRRARLARFRDPVSAEDDYFRFANRNH